MIVTIYVFVFALCVENNKYNVVNFADSGKEQTIAVPFGNNDILYAIYRPMSYLYGYLFGVLIWPLNPENIDSNQQLQKI